MPKVVALFSLSVYLVTLLNTGSYWKLSVWPRASVLVSTLPAPSYVLVNCGQPQGPAVTRGRQLEAPPEQAPKHRCLVERFQFLGGTEQKRCTLSLSVPSL
jgi:hypothetical protein